ncbi:MAG: hypothetical protein RIQ89_1753 [Bacteroidota bacterium]|jgi:futalosine hydrolase
MNEILLVTATALEMEQLQFYKTCKGYKWQRAVCGVGSMLHSWQLRDSMLERQPQLIVQAGIAGAIDTTLVIGEVVEVISDELFDLGVEDHQAFKPLYSLGLLEYENQVFDNANKHRWNNNLKKVAGITVNTAHGNQYSIDALKRSTAAQVETMEGAAVFFAGKRLNIPVMQIRAISNHVVPRNRSEWNIPLALQELNKALEKIFYASI